VKSDFLLASSCLSLRPSGRTEHSAHTGRIFMNISPTEIVGKTKTHFNVQIVFSENRVVYEKMFKYGKARKTTKWQFNAAQKTCDSHAG